MSDRHPHRRGLGRGLGSLIPTGPRSTETGDPADPAPVPGSTETFAVVAHHHD